MNGETLYNPREQPENSLIRNVFLQNSKQYSLINRGKKLAYVALQHPCGTGMVLAHDTSERPKAVHRFMRSLPHSAGIRVKNKFFIKEWVECAVDCVMQQPVTHACLVYVAGFGVRYVKMVVVTVLVKSLLSTLRVGR